jgi:hypothetical protein
MYDILFIRGFNTYQTNTYDPLFEHLKIKFPTFDKNCPKQHIQYKTNENINDICENIISNITSHCYKYIIVHSMGGFLITKVLHMIKQKNLSIYEKIKQTKFILLNPMLDQINYIKFLHIIIPIFQKYSLFHFIN